MSSKSRVTILGDGGWGTALACVNARHGHDVVLWSAFQEQADQIARDRENKKFLPGVPLQESIQISTNLKEAVDFGELIVLAIPTQFLRNILYKLTDVDLSSKILVTVAKGIEKKTHMRPSQIVKSVLGEDVSLGILSGPSHAEEVSKGVPTLVVIASSKEEVASRAQEIMGDDAFRIYIQNDEVGVELGGALKNVIAIAAGVSDGLGYGNNTKSGLLSRGLLEMTRLGAKVGANPNTFCGLSGIGDLMTTCFSEHGRNLKVGQRLGAGESIDQILGGMQMVAEGVETAASVMEWCKDLDLDLPILSEVYAMLYEGKNPKVASKDLLARDSREELKQY